MSDEPEVIPEPKSVTVVCPECNEFHKINDIHAYVLAQHLSVCREMSFLYGDSE